MDKPRLIDEGDISMVHQDEDYDEYKTLETSRIDETRHHLQNLILQKHHQPYG